MKSRRSLLSSWISSDWLLVLVVVLVRALFLPQLALVDPSEARFASAALRMVESGDWITPQIYNPESGWEPYLAKPPLQMWLMAGGISLFGVSDWVTRLPGFLAALLLAGAASIYTSVAIRKELAASVFLATFLLPGIFFVAPSPLTDGLLAATIVCASLSFFLCLKGTFSSPYTSRLWGYLMFVFLGLSALTKGPVGIVLFLGSCGLWLLLTKSWSLLGKIPWISGLILWAGISVPWYYYAELANPAQGDFPGFLRYYFFQENVMRYLSSEAAIRFGTLHTQPYGYIWLYFLVMAFPLSIILARAGYSNWRKVFSLKELSPELLFPLCQLIAPLLFFSFARQIIMTYTLPTLPAAVILSAIVFKDAPGRIATLSNRVTFLWIVTGLVYVVALFLNPLDIFLLSSIAFSVVLFFWGMHFNKRIATTCAAVCFASYTLSAPLISERRSTRTIVKQLKERENPGRKVALYGKVPFSILFYINGNTANLEPVYCATTDAKNCEQIPFGLIQRDLFNSLSEAHQQNFEIILQNTPWLLIKRH